MKRELQYGLCIVVFLLANVANATAAVACTVTTAGSPFGTFDAIDNLERDTLAEVQINCTGNPGDTVSYTIILNTGMGSFTNRQLRSGASLLRYNLYSDSAKTQIWGDGSEGSTTVSDSLSLTTSSGFRSYTIYGKIPNGQPLAAVGFYQDSISVQVTY
ncbi:MAG TPA: spore coat U domain-containing protein [Terriglobales bacterium]|nr:spore coat U domain-containing protein [Terriglobales bacterium]